jgi:hypothetical protein
VYDSAVPRLYGPAAPWLYGSTVPLLYDSAVPRLYGPAAPWLYGSTVPLLYDSAVPRLYGSTVPLLYGSAVRRLYCSAVYQACMWIFNNTKHISSISSTTRLTEVVMLSWGHCATSFSVNVHNTARLPEACILTTLQDCLGFNPWTFPRMPQKLN